MASISKVIRLSQKLRGVEPSISTLCVGFVGHILAEKSIVSYVSVSTILTFMATILQNGGHFHEYGYLFRQLRGM